jgi:hypothetical protein
MIPMDFAVRPTLSVDSTKIVLVAANPGPYPGVWATVACEDIRQEFGIAGASNDVLLQRTSIRQTNKEALGEITTNLLDAGRYTLLQGIRVINISRADLAARKNQFAWGQSDLPPMLGVLERDLTNVAAGKCEMEKSKVEGLMRLLGYNNFVTIDPNLKGETGIDVVVEYDGGRFAFQVSDFHSDEGTDLARKGSALRRQESKKTKDGLPTTMFVNADPIPGLVRRIEDKAKKRWSKRDFPETILLIAASIPERSGVASTFIWDPKVDLNKLRANLSPILGCCDYSTVFLYNMMQSRVYRWTRQTEWECVR